MTRVSDTLHSTKVLVDAGLLDWRNPVRAAKGSRQMRTLGPIAGAVNMSRRRFPDRVAAIDDEGSLTYAELDDRTNALARALLADGIRAGDAVGVLCRDHCAMVEIMVATGKAGARMVLLNTGFSAPQLVDVMRREGVTMLVADAEFATLLHTVDPAISRVTGYGRIEGLRSVDELIDATSSAPVPQPPANAGIVLLTAGTTGTPKGAPRAVASPLAAAQFLERIPHRSGDRCYVAAPLFHGTGMSQFTMVLALGSTVILRRRFDAKGALEVLDEYRATAMIMVPTMLQRMLSLGEEIIAQYDTSSLRIIMSAGAALPADLGVRATRAFGPVMHNFYGCTEVALATVATPEDWAAAPGTAGRPPRGISVKLYDERDREVTTPRTPGRIYVNNGLNFAGYSGGGGKAFIDDHMSTGDTGEWDSDGRLFVLGRDDDMIVSGGENVFPHEIEELVEGMPGIVDVATQPVDDEEFGKRLRMFVVLEDGAHVTEDAIRDHIKANLARYKVPRNIHIVPALPYTAAGKPDRRALTELAARY